MIEVIPAIIPDSFEDLRTKLVRVKGVVTRVQVDVIDGIVAPKVTWPINDPQTFEPIVEGEKGLPFWEEFQYEVHLMTKNTGSWVSDWIHAGASAVVIHPSYTENLKETINHLLEFDVEIIFGFLPSESEDFKRYVETYHEALSGIQIMGNDKIGYHGVELDEEVYDIVRELCTYYSNTIAIDIGVDEETAPKLIEAGVNKLVSGSFIFNSEDPAEAIKLLQSS